MPVPISKRSLSALDDELPFTVDWRSTSEAKYVRLDEADTTADFSFLSADYLLPQRAPVTVPDFRAIAEGASARTVARRGRAVEPPMGVREANALTAEEEALISALGRISLGRFRSLFVIYSRKVAEVLDPQGISIKSVYGNASTAEYQAHAQLLGIENVFYRLVLENAGLIPMHPGHEVYWAQEEQKRLKNQRRKTVEAQRKNAQETLNRICGSADSVPFLQQVLVNSNASSAVVSASTALTRLVTANWLNITENEKHDVYHALVSLINRPLFPELARPYLNRFFAKVVKHAWLEGAKFQTVFDDLRTGADLGRVLDTWTEVVREMNPQSGRDLSRFRRTALSFRDQALLKIAEFTWELITTIQAQRAFENNVVLHKALRLFVETLAFDFLGACPDETNDDSSSVMIPHSFTFLRQVSVPQTLFTLLPDLTAKESAKLALQALVLIASFRRSFYLRDEDRRLVLFAYLSGSAQLISGGTPATQRLVQDVDCLHEVCRLIGRMKTGEAVSDLVELDGFQQWLGAVWQLTERVRDAREDTASSRFYLLGFWAQISVSIARMTVVPPFVQEAVHRVVGGFIDELVHGEAGEVDETDVIEQLEIFSSLISSSKNFAATALQRALTQGGKRVNVAWGIHLTGVFLQAVAEQKVDNDDTLAKLAAIAGLVFQNMRSATSDAPTELANLAFLEGLRKAYLAEQARKSNDGRETSMEADVQPGRLIGKLLATLQLNEEKELLSLCLEKIVFNLNQLYENESVLKRTLQLFQDFATSVSFVETSDMGFGPQLVQGGKLLLELPGVRALINGGHRDLGFLKSNIPHFGKYRTHLYHVLGKIVFMDASLFPAFMAPIAQLLGSLWQAFQTSGLATDPGLIEVVGTLARDLRGVCMATLTQETYKLIFQFLVDDPRLQGKSRLALFTGTLELAQGKRLSQATMSILKFLAEFSLNRQSRINFDSNSPGGILLFREACKCVMGVGRLVLAPGLPSAGDALYRERLKPIGVSLSVLNHALQGQYANMALFELYGDQALSAALNTGVSMVLSVSTSELLVYSKVMKPVYTFLEQCIAKTSQINVIIENPNSACIVQVMHILEEGLLAFDGTVAMQSCTILEALCTWLFEHRTNLNNTNLAQVIPLMDQRLRAALALLVQLLVQGEFTSIWSLSRPLLPLVLLEKEHWIAVTADITKAQLTDDRKTKINKAFQAVMDHIPEDLGQKNRENFTKHVYDLSAALKQQ